MSDDEKPEIEASAVDSVDSDLSTNGKASPPTVDEWKALGKTIFQLLRQTIVALWSRLRPFLQDLLATVETAFAKVRTNFGKPDISQQINGKPEGQENSESQNPNASLLANAAFFTGIPSLFLCCGPAGIVAIVLGILALVNPHRDSKLTNQRAVIGIASGFVSSVLSLGLMLLVLAVGTVNNATVSDWSLVKGRMSQWDSATHDEKTEACEFFLHVALLHDRDRFNPAILLILETSSNADEHQAAVHELALDVVDEMNSTSFASSLKVEEAAVRSMVSLGWLE